MVADSRGGPDADDGSNAGNAGPPGPGAGSSDQDTVERVCEPGYPFTFQCQRSGNCCSVPGGVVKVSGPELVAIAEFLGLAPSIVRARYFQRGNDLLRDVPGTSRCVFLKEGKSPGGGPRATCSIHPVRPEQCRQWPFWPGLKEDPELLEHALRMCPGMHRLAPTER